MVTIIWFIVIMTILIVCHELGHLFSAKKLGLKVETFSLGMGPKIKSFFWRGTNYTLSLIPIGGYVEMGDELPKERFDSLSVNYMERPPLDKIIVAISGPVANFALAIILLSVTYMIGVKMPTYMDDPARIGWVDAASPSAKAGLRAGDIVCAVDGVVVTNWQNMVDQFSISSKSRAVVKFHRDGQTSYSTLYQVSRLNFGLFPSQKIVVDTVVKDSPANSAGIQEGDIVTAVEGEPVSAWAQFVNMVSSGKTSLAINVERNGRALTLRVSPMIDSKTKKGFIGVSNKTEEKTKQLSFPNAVGVGFTRTLDISVDSVATIWGLVTGHVSFKALGGPIMIAQLSGKTAKAGFVPLLTFVAFLSIQLGIFNLLPFIPVLDGGQIATFLVEMVRRQPTQAISLTRLAKAGWIAIGCLVLGVTYVDIIRLLSTVFSN